MIAARTGRVLVALVLLLAALKLHAQPTPAATPPLTSTGSAVTHYLSFPDLARQYVQVESVFPADGQTTLLKLPRWTPGSYQIHNFDADIHQFAARSNDGRILAVEKSSSDTWRLETEGLERFRVSYRVHASRLNVSHSWVSPQYVLLNFTSVLMYTDASRPLAQALTVTPPPELSNALSPLAAAGRAYAWSASDYDELVDSPLVVTDQSPQRFRVDNRGYVLAHAGDARYWRDEQIIEDLQAVIGTHNDFWGEVPLRRDYWIFNVLSEYGGGLEHDHSTVLMAARRQALNRKDYIHWLSLVSHEYFHVWNVRRMRPLELAVYDYQAPQHTSSLWFAEGITSYYDDLLLSRAKVISPVEYLERLALHIHSLEMTPGRMETSLRQASLDAWTRQYQPDANAINSQVSYYIKGAVLAFVLDTRLREESRDRKNLDDVMRDMYQRWGQQAYPEQAFAEALERVAGAELRQWFELMLSTAAEPDVDAALEWFGLALERHPLKAQVEAAGGTVGAGLGINIGNDPNRLVVDMVIDGLAAADAGIQPGDELLAIDDQRLLPGEFEAFRLRLRPEQQVVVLLARQGQILSLPLTTGERRPGRYEIRSLPRFGDRQMRRLQRWLGQAVNRG